MFAGLKLLLTVRKIFDPLNTYQPITELLKDTWFLTHLSHSDCAEWVRNEDKVDVSVASTTSSTQKAFLHFLLYISVIAFFAL